MMGKFRDQLLVIPEKEDLERNAVAAVWEEYGGDVMRVSRFWDPPQLPIGKVRLYGNHLFCLILAEKLGLKLLSPADDLLMKFSPKWLKRTIRKSSIIEAAGFVYPCFIKSLVPKLFTARRYDSYSELLGECIMLAGDTLLIYSDLVTFKAEARAFILNGQIVSLSLYEGEADLKEAMIFLQAFIMENLPLLPVTCVLDLGDIVDAGWAILEANPVWGAGLNGGDPLAAAECI